MPWHIVEGHDECPAGKPVAVVRDADGHVEGCHADEGAAGKQMAALYASEDATKAEGEREEAQAEKEKRARKYGISAKEGKPVTKPAQFASVAEADFGDPVNWAYPADATHARAALGYFNHAGQREAGGYTSEEWGIIGRRLATRVSRHLDAGYEYRDGKLQRKEESKAGRVLSAPNAKRIVSAYVALGKVLEAAGIDVPGVDGEQKTVDGDGTVMAVVGPYPWDVAYVGAEPLKGSPLAVKLLGETADHYVVGGYGHVWGDAQHKDLVGDYFTPSSDLVPDLVAVKLVFFDHALNLAPDGKRFDHVLGIAPEAETKTDNIGKWIQAQLDKRAAYVDAVMDLVKRGVLSWSSGAVPHLVKRARDGWLERWPVAEYTLTPTPAEPRQTDVKELAAAYKAAGIELLIDQAESLTAEGPQSEGKQARALAMERERTRLISRLID